MDVQSLLSLNQSSKSGNEDSNYFLMGKKTKNSEKLLAIKEDEENVLSRNQKEKKKQKKSKVN